MNKDNKDVDTKAYVNVEEIIDEDTIENNDSDTYSEDSSEERFDDEDTKSTNENNDTDDSNNIKDNKDFTKKDLQILWGFIIVIVCGIVGISFAINIYNSNDSNNNTSSIYNTNDNSSNNSSNNNSGLIKKTAYCESGYKLNSNNMCEKTDTITAEETITYYCVDSSMQLVGTQCVSKTYFEPIVDYTCPTWYRYSYLYNTCVISSYKSNNDPCPGDSVQILGQCYPYKTKPTRIDRKCYTGTLVGTQCVLETKVSAIPNYTYTCPVGYTQVRDTICTKTITKEPSYK